MKLHFKQYLGALVMIATALSASMAAHAATPGGDVPPELLNVPDFLSQDVVPLTKQERQALGLSRQWSGRGPAPVLSHSGKLTYVHGASLPTIIASPM